MIDPTMDFNETPPDIESFFPPNLSDEDTGPHFWTISDDDFEPDPPPLQYNLPPQIDQPIYDEYSEAGARAEQPTTTPEEQEYLAFLENLEYSEFSGYHLYLYRILIHPCDRWGSL